MTAARNRLVDLLARGIVQSAVKWATKGAVAFVESGQFEQRAAKVDPEVTVMVHDPGAYRAVITSASVGLGNSYAAGLWDCDDLVKLLRIATSALPAPRSPLAIIIGLARRLRGERSGGRSDNLDRVRADVQAHYDLGDDFFALFLDPTLTYSCGIFETPSKSMEEASIAKLDRICRNLRLVAGEEILEIGTGWGSFAIHAAGQYGCRVTTTTISDRQLIYSRRRVSQAGLDHLVTVVGKDYRDISGSYDHIVSIEMIEAIGWRQQDRFFQTCVNLLRPGGTMALQAIVIDDRLYERAKHQEDFIKALIFPGSSIPSKASITASASRAGLGIFKREDLGQHYAETLHRWRISFDENRGQIAELGYEPNFLRLWDLYLAYCEAGFAESRIGNVQLILQRHSDIAIDKNFQVAPTTSQAARELSPYDNLPEYG